MAKQRVMPNEEWRHELQDFVQLFEAAISGDRQNSAKVLTDYISGRTRRDQEGAATATKSSGRKQEDLEEEDADEEADENYGEDGDPNGEFDEYYPEDEEEEETYDETSQTKRVRFADNEEGGGGEGEGEEEEYYDEDDQGQDDPDEYFDAEENEDYVEDYDPGEYDETEEDGGAYMSGALPAEDETHGTYDNEFDGEGNGDDGMYYDPDEYNDTEYDGAAYSSGAAQEGDEFDGDGYNYGDDVGNYENDAQDAAFGDETAGAGQYDEYYDESTEDAQGYYDSTVAQDANGYGGADQGNGGEWNEDVHQNEQFTDDQVQDYGINDGEDNHDNNADDADDDNYLEDQPQTNQEPDLLDLLQRLQEAFMDGESGDPHSQLTGEEEEPQYGLDGYEDEEELDNQEQAPYGHDLNEDLSTQMPIINRRNSSKGNGGANSRSLPYPPDDESVYDDQEDDEDEFENDNPADEDEIRGYSDDLAHLQRQFFDDEPDLEEEDWDASAVFNDSFQGTNQRDPSRQNFEEDGFWKNPVRPHFDDAAPYPDFSRTRSNEDFVPYPLPMGNGFDDEGTRRQSMQPVNPHFNVFDGGQRFYDHYTDSCEAPKTETRRNFRKAGLNPRTLVDRFRERMYAG